MSDEKLKDLEIIMDPNDPNWIGIALENGYIGYNILNPRGTKASQFYGSPIKEVDEFEVIGTLDELLHLIRTKYNANS